MDYYSSLRFEINNYDRPFMTGKPKLFKNSCFFDKDFGVAWRIE